MKKILIALVLGFVLTGCSANDANRLVDNKNVAETKEVVPTENAASKEQNLNSEKMNEIQISDTGLSLQIPELWNSDKYKIYNDNNSIMVDYTGDKRLSFFTITVIGKKGIEIPDVGLKMEVKTVDDWVMTISYGYELLYSHLEEIRKDNPSEYFDMADSVQKIISSLKIADKSKFERWLSEGNIKENLPGPTPNTPIVGEKSEYNKYSNFLGINDKVQMFIKEDIDLDGKQEIVIVFDGDHGLKTFILREDGDKMQKIGQIEESGYGISNVELIKLKGEKKKYIKTELTNWANLSGFELYEVDKNNVRQIIYSASATGAGGDYLIDSDKDGYYEGFIQNRYSYDVLHYYVSRVFHWNGQDFELYKTSISLDNYPENLKDVVLQFLKLTLLNSYEEKCDELTKRLSELNISDKKLKFKDEYAWSEALQIENIDFDEDENGNVAKVTVIMQNESIEFKLAKKNGKWHITDFNGANVINSTN